MGIRAGIWPGLCAAAVALASPMAGAYPNNNGCGTISGYSGRDGFSCESCHSGGSYNYGLSITGGSSKIARSASSGYTLSFTKASGTTAGRAGMNIAVEDTTGDGNGEGTLSSADADVQTAGTDELAHNHPLTPDVSGHFSWTFSWTAPATAGTYTIYAAGNPVNNNANGDCSTGMSGDGAVRTTSRNIVVNAPPTISGVDSTAGFMEGGSAVLVDGSITVADTDDINFNRAEVEISANYESGADTLACGVGGLTCSFSGGLLAITGTASEATYAAVLEGVTFSNSSQNPSALTRTIRIRVRDADISEYSAYDSRTLSVTAVNDAPSLGATVGNNSYTENAAAVTVDGAITISDVDSTQLNQATVSITGNFQSGEDTLVCPNPQVSTITCNYSSGTGVLTLSGTNTLANYELALEDVGYQNSSDNPSTLSRTLSFVARDTGNSSSTADTSVIAVNASNDAPVAADDPVGIGKNTTGNTIDVLANDSDVDSGSLAITLVGPPSAGGSVSIQGSAPNQSLLYSPATNYSGAETISYTISDGALTDTATVTVTVSTGSAPTPVADAFNATEDSSANNFDVLANDTDPDGVSDTKTVTLVNGSGTFPVATTNGSVSRSGSGVDNTLLYTPAANYNGADSFTYTVQDAGGLTATANVSVTISAINDAPSISAPASIGVTEDAASALTGVGFADVDAASGSLTATFSVASGTLSASSGGGVTAGGTASARTLSGTLANLNAFLSGGNLAFTTASNGNSSVALDVALSDGGNTGSGGTQSATPASVTLNVTAVNDAPQITSTADTTADDGVGYSYTLTVSDPDDTAWTFDLANEPAGMSVDASGVVTWTPPCSTTLAGYTTATITASAADGGENGVSAAAQPWQITVAAPDGDGDGMPNCYESANGFDPDDGADGAGDRDGDGVSNADEFLAGTDPDLDNVAPVVTAPVDVVVPSTGYLTVVDLGAATAVDVLDGDLTATADLASTALRPGRYTVTWTASDAAGNVATDTQQVDVLPRVSIYGSWVGGEGGLGLVVVQINGDAPEYPVEIPYSISGTADAGDTDAGDGILTINAGVTTEVVSFDIFDDGVAEGDETVTLTLTGASNAALGSTRAHTVTITEGNALPSVWLSGSQAGLTRFMAYQADGLYALDAIAFDVSGGTSLTYDWSESADALGIDAVTGAQPTFDPASLPAGAYPVRVIVDDGAGGSAEASVLLLVASGTSAVADEDTDGIADDVDAILDYRAVLPNQAGDPASAELLETDAGRTLRRGRTSLAAGRTGALIAMSDIVTFGVGAGAMPLGADSYDNVGGIFDFEVHFLEPGGTARVVLPLQTAIREGSVYRKLDPATGWHDFVIDQNNAVASVRSTLGQCPGPDSDAYVDGLQPFADCVRLTLEDGGPNDADGVADRVVRDPGGVAVIAGADTGDSVSSGAFLALWLLPLAALRRLRRRLGAAMLALATMLVALPAHADHHIRIHYSGDVASGFDNNVTNAQEDDDIRESGFASATGNVDYLRNLSLYTTLLLRGSAQGEYWNSFDGLNNGKGTAMARLLYRGDGDFYTPTFAGWASAAVMEFDSAIRDSNEYRAGAFVTENLTTQVTGRLALGASRRESDGLVYDLSGYSASLNLDWVPAPRTVVYTGYQYYVGDVASTASSTSFWIVDAADAIEADDAFGGLAGGLLAYRLDAKAQVTTLGFNYAFSRKLSADVQGQYISTRATARIDYERTVGVVSLLARF